MRFDFRRIFVLGPRVLALVGTGAIAGLLALPGGAVAQPAVPGFPASAQPGQIINQPDLDRRELQRSIDIVTLPDSEIGAAAGSTDEIFVLQDVVLDGSTLLDAAAIAPIVGDYLGQMVSFADLNAIARAITLLYRSEGFVLSQAVLAPQEIEDGIVHVQVVEGQITTVEIIGEYREINGLIEAMANRIVEAGPVNTETLERYLLLIDDLPGISARGAIQPGEGLGSGHLVITVEQKDFEAAASMDNLGSRFVGPYRGTIVAAVNSAFGLHDRSTVRGIISGFDGQTRELRFADGMHEQQIGSNGLRVRIRGAITHTHPGGATAPLALEGNSHIGEIQALYPLIRSRQLNVNLLAGFGILDSKNSLAGIMISRDRVRHFWAGARVDFTDALAGVTQAELQLTQGVDILSASDDGLGRTRINGRHEFTRVNGQVTRIQEITGEVSVKVVAAGQYAFESLLASEEFSIGRTDFGRAYDFAEVVGDHGAAGAVELRWAGPPVHEYVESYQFYGFFDFGSVWNESPAVGEMPQVSLASTGGGVRFNLAQDISGFLEVGLPLTLPVASRGSDHFNDVRIFFSILKRI